MAKNLLGDLSAKDGLDDSSLLRTLIDSLPDQVYVKDTKGCYLLSNTKHVEALRAASSEEVAGKSDFDFYPKELAERYRADEEEIIRSGQPLVCREKPSMDEEGNRRWHLTMKVPLRDGSGKIVGIVGMTRDVTERKEAEEKLKESERRFHSLTQNALDLITILDEDGTIRYKSPVVERILGYEEEEILGTTVFDYIHQRTLNT